MSIAPDKVTFRKRTLALDAAQSPRPYNFAGHYFRIVDASDAAVEVTVHVDDVSGEPLTLRNGEGWVHRPFDRLFLSWNAQPGDTVSIVWGGNPRQAQSELFQFFPAVTAGDVQVVNSSLAVHPADAAGLLTRPALRRADTMPELVQAQHIPAAVGGVDFYTVPAGKEAIVYRVTANHVEGSTHHFSLSIRNSSGAAMHEVRVSGVHTEVLEGIVLPTGWRLRVYTYTVPSNQAFFTAEVGEYVP